jgi:hypothetical protein
LVEQRTKWVASAGKEMKSTGDRLLGSKGKKSNW